MMRTSYRDLGLSSRGRCFFKTRRVDLVTFMDQTTEILQQTTNDREQRVPDQSEIEVDARSRVVFVFSTR